MASTKISWNTSLSRTNTTLRLNRWINGESLFALILIGFTIFFAIPAIRGVAISFTDWNMIKEPTLAGLKNHNKLFSDDDFWEALVVTLRYVAWNIPIQTLLALFIALVMDKFQNSAWLRLPARTSLANQVSYSRRFNQPQKPRFRCVPIMALM
jgi:ABC-type sugar transport system permease subunit